MSEVAQPSAEAGATAVDPEKIVTPASEAPEAAAAEADPQTEQATEQDGQHRDPATGRFAKRTEQLTRQIGELTATKHNLRRQVDALVDRHAALQKQLQTQPQNFDQMTYEQQQAHMVTNAVKQTRLEEVAQEAEALHKQSYAVMAAVYQTKIDAARDRLQGIDQAARLVGSMPLSPVACEVIAESDKAAELTHWLADPKNEHEVRRILSLPPSSQAVELARQEGRLTAPQPTRRISKAPAPVQTVSGGTGTAGVDLNTADMATYMRVRMGG
jgi:hypothetical protein